MRHERARYYSQRLQNVALVQTPCIKEDRTHVFQTFAVRIKKHRDRVLEAMKQKGVGVLIHYPIPLHLQEAYQELGHKPGDFPVSELLSQEVLSLPMFPHMSHDQIETVCLTLKEALPQPALK
jgi:dTDP-4-amino-4,6-dideoxygalactose transaminase